MPLTKEERYARHRAYQSTPEARDKRRAYDNARHQTPEYRAWIKARLASPEYKERARIASKKYRSTPQYRVYKKKYRSSPRAKDARRNQLLLKQFGITLAEYNQLLDKQGGRCAICHEPETFIMRGVIHSLAVDHCHRTGKLRGILCRNCNQALGLFKDKITSLREAAEYLQLYYGV